MASMPVRAWRAFRCAHFLRGRFFSLHFKRETLKAQLEQLLRDRKVVRPSIRPHGIRSHFPKGHHDLLRALGFDLDEAQAHSAFIDELEDGFVLTNTCPEEPGSITWTKKMVVLGLQEIEAILNAAFERRSKAKNFNVMHIYSRSGWYLRNDNLK